MKKRIVKGEIIQGYAYKYRAEIKVNGELSISKSSDILWWTKRWLRKEVKRLYNTEDPSYYQYQLPPKEEK